MIRDNNNVGFIFSIVVLDGNSDMIQVFNLGAKNSGYVYSEKALAEVVSICEDSYGKRYSANGLSLISDFLKRSIKQSSENIYCLNLSHPEKNKTVNVGDIFIVLRTMSNEEYIAQKLAQKHKEGGVGI